MKNEEQFKEILKENGLLIIEAEKGLAPNSNVLESERILNSMQAAYNLGTSLSEDTIEKWISVNDGLPKDEQVVLVWQLVIDDITEIGTRRLAYVFEDRWYTGVKQILRVTHWQPLPTPPTKDI